MKHMKKLALLSVILLTLLMGSCGNILFENQFGKAGLGQPTDADIDAQAQSSNPVIAQPALAIKVETKLETSGAAPIVNNLVNVLVEQGSNLSSIGNSSADMNSFLTTLIPEETLNTPGALAAAINGIVSAQSDLDALATSAGTNTVYSVNGVNSLQMATTGVLAQVFTTMTVGAGATSTDVGGALEEFINTPNANITDYVNFGGIDETTLTSDPTTNTLLLLAGIDVSAWL